MPYIGRGVRASLDEGRKATQPGELNYQISKLANDYLAMRGISYTVLNEIIGAMECAKLELYRRVAAPYEDKKLIEAGEVFNAII
jgi:uncharacterized protein DUF6899